MGQARAGIPRLRMRANLSLALLFTPQRGGSVELAELRLTPMRD